MISLWIVDFRFTILELQGCHKDAKTQSFTKVDLLQGVTKSTIVNLKNRLTLDQLFVLDSMGLIIA